eukprot:gene18937-24744_t
MSESVGNALSYSLSIRVDRPIAACELTPYPFLTVKGGGLDNVTRNKILESRPHYFTCQWSRASKRPLCCNSQCPRRHSSSPSLWSRHARGGPTLRCAVCERNRVPRSESCFCSANCFKSAWSQHSTNKHTIINKSTYQTNEKLKLLADEDESTRDRSESEMVDETSYNQQVYENDVNVEWTIISKEKSYTPSLEDIGCVLRIEIYAYAVNDHVLLAGPVVVDTEPVLAAPDAPPKRQIVNIPSTLASASSASARFRVVSYNILSELYATKQAYPYCDQWMLSWPYRRHMLLQELSDCEGDIICLQEVQADHFELHLKPFFTNIGYECLYKQKSRESMGIYGKVDGCAMFWNRNKFSVIDNYTIDFNDLARREVDKMNLDEADIRKYITRLSRDNIAQVAFLEVLHTMSGQRQLICVANTHLYANYQRPDVKLWQTKTLLNEIQQLLLSRTVNSDIPLVLCGDFNSEPSSAVYELIVKGSIQQPRPEITDTSDNLTVVQNLHILSHRLDLTSAMTSCSGIGTEPAFTNYTANFKGTLDYIFYSHSRLRVLSVAIIPTEVDINKNCGVGMPAACYPSDHFMLCCDILLLNNNNTSRGRLNQNNMNNNRTK